MKRFSETDKWKDTWFRKLKPSEKLLWLYILDTCDNAGFWEYDLEMCCFITKMTEDQVEGAIKGLNRGLTAAKSEPIYYVKNFLRHQKNDNLNPSNNAHKQIISILEEKSKLFDSKVAPNKPLNRGSGKGKGKGTGKSNGKEADPDFVTGVLSELSESKRESIVRWIAYKKEKGQTYKKIGLEGLVKKWSAHSDEVIKLAVETSIANNWAGAFPDKVDTSGSSTPDMKGGRSAVGNQRSKMV